MDAAQLDVEGGEVQALAVGPPAPPPKPRPRKPVEPPAPEPGPGQTDLDNQLGIDALFPIPLRGEVTP